MSIFSAGRETLDAAFAYAGEAVAYARGTRILARCRAKPGRTVFGAEARYHNANLRFCQRDFIFRAADLPAAPWTPETGDVIDWAGEKYMVLAPTGEPVWREHSRGTIRVHSKRIE